MTAALAGAPAAGARPLRAAAVRPVEEPDATVAAALAGDRDAFATLVARYRAELQVHCVRIMRSPEQAEDALQEALLRAWRARTGFAGRSSFRAWLYRIATNACLDEMRRDKTRPRRQQPPRLVPLDDEALPPEAAAEPGPELLAEAGETLRHAFHTVIALLPPRQRAALLLCEVLRCPATEVAGLLGCSPAAVHSALQRARATLAQDQPGLTDGPGAARTVGAAERMLLDGYVDAVRRGDVSAVATLAAA